MNATDTLILAAQVRHQMPKKAAMNLAKNVLDQGSYFIPGVGTARMGYDAYKDFRNGNYFGGAANLVGAGLSLIPGAGGFMGKGLTGLARMGGRSLIRAGAPTLGRAFGRSLGAAGRGMSLLGTAVDRGVTGAGNRLVGTAGRIPGVGGITAKTMSGVGNIVQQRPIMTAVGGIGAQMGLNNAQAGVNYAREAQQSQMSGMNDMLQNFRRSPVMTNPLFAGGGQNMRLGF